MESILTSIKKLLGIAEDDISFDIDIIIFINSTLTILQQIGIGPSTGFSIIDKTQTWTDFIGTQTDSLGNPINVESVKTYTYLKVRLVFDPPVNAFVVEAMERQIKELEWRLNALVDKPVPPALPVIEEEEVIWNWS
jgi:hypothetical protein